MDSDVPVGPSPSMSDAADTVRRWLDDRGQLTAGSFLDFRQGNRTFTSDHRIRSSPRKGRAVEDFRDPSGMEGGRLRRHRLPPI